jgi:hypothetical protein
LYNAQPGAGAIPAGVFVAPTLVPAVFTQAAPGVKTVAVHGLSVAKHKVEMKTSDSSKYFMALVVFFSVFTNIETIYESPL